MNEIRKNYETEVEILRIKFKIPAVIIIKMLVSFITLKNSQFQTLYI